MISPLALALALAFWAPSNGGVNPCPSTPAQPTGVQVIYFTPDQPQTAGDVTFDGYAINGWSMYGGGCVIHIRSDVPHETIPYQCMVIAHELGHGVFSLKHTPNTIMAAITSDRPIPGACYPPVPAPSRVSPRPDDVTAYTCGAEDDPTWTWSRCGNRKRGVRVRTHDGSIRREVVGPCRYRKLARTSRLMDRPQDHLRGDAWAKRYGCTRQFEQV